MKKMIIFAAAFFMSLTVIHAQEKAGKRDTTTRISLYTCPNHPGVTTDKLGKCPICGMDLNLSLKEKMKADVANVYACPMHPDVTSNKPDKCPKCGMAFTINK